MGLKKFLILNKNSWNCQTDGLRKFPIFANDFDNDFLYDWYFPLKATALSSSYLVSNRLTRKFITIKRNKPEEAKLKKKRVDFVSPFKSLSFP